MATAIEALRPLPGKPGRPVNTDDTPYGDIANLVEHVLAAGPVRDPNIDRAIWQLVLWLDDLQTTWSLEMIERFGHQGVWQ